ncbi:unnamed protein product [Prunus armeniaca]
MPGISPDIINHKLSISPAYKLVRYKRRSYDVKWYEAMRTEVDKLKAISFIREATYPVWLANSIMVRKPKGGWRMSQGISRPKELHEQSTAIIKTTSWRSSPSLPFCIQHCR